MATKGASGLSHLQLLEMWERGMKYSTENKINKDNAFEFDFIDHLPDLIDAVSARAGQFAFQSATSTLDAGVVIYGKRVEALHDVALSNMLGFKKSGGDPEDGGADAEGGNGTRAADEAAAGAGGRKRRRGGGGVPSDTLASADALRKKITKVTFDADALFARTSKLFDENSVSGLLLLNMPVYDFCNVMFDSREVPMTKFVVPHLDGDDSPSSAGGDVALGRLLDFRAEGGGLSAAVADVLRAVDDASAAALMPSLSELYALLEGGGDAAALDGARAEGAALAERLLQEERARRQQRQAARSSGGGLASEGTSRPDAPPAGRGGTSMHPGDSQSGDGGGFGGSSWQDDSGRDADVSTGGGGAASAGLPDLMGQMNLGDDWRDTEQDGGGDGGGGAYELWDGGDAGGDSDDDDGGAGGTQGGVGGMGASKVGPHSAGGSALDSDLLSWIEGGGVGEFGQVGLKNWRRPPAYMARTAAAAKAAPKRRPRPTIEAIDFEANFSPADLEVALASEKELCLKTTKAASTLMTEAELLWKSETLGRLVLLPEVSITSIWRRRHAAEAAAAAAAASRQRQRQDDDGDGGGCASGVGGGGDYSGGGDDEWDCDDDGGDDGGGGYEVGEDGFRDFTARAEEEDENDPLGLGLLLLPPPRAVKRIDVNYARTAKHVDVKALKDALDVCLKDLQAPGSQQQQQQGGAGSSSSRSERAPEALDFKQMVEALPADGAMGPLSEVSVHLCFICLLHLANEQGLALNNTGRLDTLHVTTKSPGGTTTAA